MSKQVLTKELFQTEDDAFDIDYLSELLKRIKKESKGYFNIQLKAHADYDGNITGYSIVGERLETDTEESKRLDIGKAIAAAFNTPEAIAERRAMGENV